jgi:hypothetical protein
MYLSFALMGVIRIGLFTPQANTASKEIHQQIMDALSGINNKVTNIDSIVRGLEGHSISLRISDKDVSTGYYTVLPVQEGKVYVGHLSVSQSGHAGVTLYWQCNNGATTVLGATNIADESTLNADFSCEDMQVYADVEGGGPISIDLRGSISYVQYDATEVTDIS